jgi:MoxR-like ATPase
MPSTRLARARGPFVSVNIAAVPDTLLEAEFFGVAPGAYTGADRKGRDGKFKLADGGTLFLDEIGDMPLALQPKLLRALQEGEIEPLGSNKVVPFDARVIAATSRDLPALVREGKFREDLYYRLNVLPIKVPPLRERAPTSRRWPRCWARTSRCATAPRPFELTPEALACCRADAGAATSASCATCWSRPRCAATRSASQSKEIRIAHVYSRTGPLEAYGKQTQTGLMMGLDYATGGTMTVNGRRSS